MSTEKNEQELESGLMDFSWDDSEDFFGIKPKEEPEKVTETKTVTEVEDEEETPTNLDKKKKEEPEKEEVFFDEEDEVESPKSQNEFSYSNAYKILKEKGVITIDVENESEVDEDTFIQLQEEEIETRLEETIKSFMEELDDDAKAFLRFKKEGGDTTQFFEIYKELSEAPIPTQGDERSEIKFLKHYYKNYEDLDDEDIEDKIEFLKETGKLSKYAHKHYETLEEAIEERKEEAVKRQQALQKQQEEVKKQYVKDLKNTIEDAEKIKDWTITPKDKKVLHNYMTKAAVKIGNNQYLTQFQNDLQEAFKDKEKTILLAKLLANDFDLSDIKEKAKSELVKETKNKLSSGKITPVNSKGSRNKGLADYF